MKPKENTIAKIEQICEQISAAPPPSFDPALAEALRLRCHSMNIHKAKLAYFQRIKVVLGQVVELGARQTAHSQTALLEEIRQVAQEIRALLETRNG